MSDNDKHRDFLAYINNVMSKETIIMVYEANSVRFEKCELYSDFVQSLLRLVFNTYMGDEVTSIEEQIKHFNWCWNRNLNNFREEGVCFEGAKLYDYFFAYMVEVFYPQEKKPIDCIDRPSLKLWCEIFDYNRAKTNSELDTFLEIYKIFEKSISYS